MHVLVVDDEPAVRDSLARSLRFEGYEVSLASDGERALAAIGTSPPDVIVLDVLMPRLDGLATCRRLRADGSDIPVLMLTARDGISDRVVGLDAGADDYLVKPFALEELLARLRALLRRRPSGDDASTVLEFADLTLDPVTREVRRGERPLSLTVTEFNLLEMLLEHPRQVLTRAQIVERVWGFSLEYSSNSLEVYIGYLRRKLEAEGESRLIHTVRGVGYVLRDTPP
ncbi:MAG TPA: response regulator transcription factor [Mycobacteriales bacterium]|jgi:two-component system response regulator MprA|nr:response regulator transcription factor [Mycobacteriales bacterium]